MTTDGSWVERVADSAKQAGKDAWLGLEASAIIASSPAGLVENSGLVTDPVDNAAITALSNANESLSEMVQARGKADELAESTDVVHEQTSSLLVDPPSWLEDARDLAGDEAESFDDSDGFV